MNRAASLCWATAVALVLSASPAFAEKKVIKFPNKIQHTRVVSHDALNTVVESNNVPEQTVSNRAGSNTVKFKPKARVKAPKVGIKDRMKNVLKTKPGAAAVQVGIIAALAAVDWVMSDDNTKLQKKQSKVDGVIVGNTVDGVHPALLCNSYAASQTLNKMTVVNYGGLKYSVAVFPVGVGGVWSGPSGYGESGNSCTNSSLGYTPSSAGYFPVAKNRVIGASDITVSKVDLAEADYDAFVNSFDSKNVADYQTIYDAFVAIDPEIGMFLPEYLTAPDGAMTQAMSSPLRQSESARLNPDGSVTKLTRKEWGDFTMTYNPLNTDVDYKVVNHNEVYNEAGQKVEDETVTEEGPAEDSAPQLSTALDTANQPLTEWATEIKTPPSSPTAGISYPLLFTYGGTCSIAPIVLPRIGSYSLDSICTAVNDWVKPILGVLFAAWTVLHIFGVWRETTMNVRPS